MGDLFEAHGDQRIRHRRRLCRLPQPRAAFEKFLKETGKTLGNTELTMMMRAVDSDLDGTQFPAIRFCSYAAMQCRPLGAADRCH